MNEKYIATLCCENRPGIVAAVATGLARSGGDIAEAQQFDDPLSNKFFLRMVFAAPKAIEPFRAEMEEISTKFGMTYQIRPLNYRPKALILVSKFDHCLGDLLYRHRVGELPMEVAGVIGNHPRDVLNISLLDGIPYHHLSVSKENKHEQEGQIRALMAELSAELVILARYMQVLSDGMAAHLSGRCINIHHSFLPAFKGAKPYHQAHARGVKMIGATAHYVTTDLDEGPIIAQDVERVTHADTADDMVVKGRAIEQRVLARAVRLHLEARVLLNGPRTVVFER